MCTPPNSAKRSRMGRCTKKNVRERGEEKSRPFEPVFCATLTHGVVGVLGERTKKMLFDCSFSGVT